MHKFLRAIGFSKLENRSQLQALIAETIKTPTQRLFTTFGEDALIAEYSKSYGENVGLTVCGEMDDEDRLLYDYCYPYFLGSHIGSTEDISIERHADKLSFAGVCDDNKIGISIIFYLQNRIPYIRLNSTNQLPMKGTSLTLSGLSTAGMIMMPIVKKEGDKEKSITVSKNRSKLLAAARSGDEEAIESLTLDDMDVYTSISRKIHKEDLFSLVDSYFMPYGVECDQYSILGEIIDYQKVQNVLTKEEMYQMTLVCNELTIDVCINIMDMFGEPEIGRRFKGSIWLQGHINYPS